MSAAKKHGLGRGLDSLIPTVVEPEFDPTLKSGSGARDEVLQVAPAQVTANPHQPRQTFDEAALAELAGSIKKHGILQPLVVSRQGVNYQLIAGERRLRAAKLAGLAQVPVIVRSYDEQQKLELALIENIQREELNPVETAAAFKKLADEFNLSHEAIGAQVGKDRTTVANIIRLLGLPLEAKRALAAGSISEAHARAILSVPPEKQAELLALIIKNGWTVRQSEQFARGFKSGGDGHAKGLARIADQNELTKNLEGYLGAKVRLTHTAKTQRLIIEVKNEAELERIARLIQQAKSS